MGWFILTGVSVAAVWGADALGASHEGIGGVLMLVGMVWAVAIEIAQEDGQKRADQKYRDQERERFERERP